MLCLSVTRHRVNRKKKSRAGTAYKIERIRYGFGFFFILIKQKAVWVIDVIVFFNVVQFPILCRENVSRTSF